MVIDTGAPPPTTGARAALWTVVAVFLYSAVWSLVDPTGTRADTEGLGYPAFTSTRRRSPSRRDWP